MVDPVQQSRVEVAGWIARERSAYADAGKYKEGSLGRNLIRVYLAGDNASQAAALQFVFSYLDRAERFGLDTHQGRQALGKAVVAAMHILETAVELHGPMPLPGVPSGDIQKWGT